MCSEPSFNERTSNWSLLRNQRNLSAAWFIVVLYILTVRVSCTSDQNFPTCGFIYYLINTVILLIGLVAFIIVAWRYEYRERDEPDNIYRYAEEYYANVQDEPNSDYDDLDNP